MDMRQNADQGAAGWGSPEIKRPCYREKRAGGKIEKVARRTSQDGNGDTINPDYRPSAFRASMAKWCRDGFNLFSCPAGHSK